jgi:hypothetical protein
MADVLVNGEKFNATGTVKDGVITTDEQRQADQGNQAQTQGSPSETDFGALNADDFLAAVEGGRLSKEDALRLEQGRDKPRKTVLEALESKQEGGEG